MAVDSLSREQQAHLLYLTSLASFVLYDRHPCLLYTRLGFNATNRLALSGLVIVRETLPSIEATSVIPALKMSLQSLLQSPTPRNSIIRDEEVIQAIEPILSDLPISDASKVDLYLQYRQNVSLELMTSDEASEDLGLVRSITAGGPTGTDVETNGLALRVTEGVEEAAATLYMDLICLKEALKGVSMANNALDLLARKTYRRLQAYECYSLLESELASQASMETDDEQ